MSFFILVFKCFFYVLQNTYSESNSRRIAVGGLFPRCYFIPTQRLTNQEPLYIEAPERAAQDSGFPWQRYQCFRRQTQKYNIQLE